ncbi:MAG: type II toxin-antitoxin system HicA family toxin [Patescibacteria group bacterium]
MPRPISRLVLIRKLKKLGFIGPYSGGRHEFMEKDNLRLSIPNPHHRDIGVKLIAIILKQIGVSFDDFDSL